MVLQLSHHKLSHGCIAGVLPTKELGVACHGATENHANIERATDPFGERAPRYGTHEEAYQPVSPPHGTMRDLFRGFAREHNVVDKDRYVPLDALGP